MILPVLPLPEQHHNFLNVVLPIVVIAVACIVAPCLAPFLLMVQAEIYALNDALNARPGATLNEFLLYVINSGQKTPAMMWGAPVPRCPHCEFITTGVDYHPSSLKYGR